MTTASRPDVLVVGGGVIGCALARELAGRGLRAKVLERGPIGAEASWAAAGLLSPQSDGHADGPFFRLALASHRLYPEWTRTLEEETGVSVGYVRSGVLRCALDEGEEGRFSRFLWQEEQGLALERLDRSSLGARAGIPLGADVRAALFFPDEGVVEPRRLTRALSAAAVRRGVELVPGTAVRRFWIEGGRCRGVETDTDRIEAGAVVDAAGAWAAFGGEAPRSIPVEPVRGQMLELDLGRETPRTVLHGEAAYVVPHADGRSLVGSTIERVGFDKSVTADAVRRLLDAAARLAPSTAAGRFVTAWSGLRPSTPDGMPLLGDSGVEGLCLATGHYRNGILLAPMTSLLVADRLAGGAAPQLEPFSVARFDAIRAGLPTDRPPARIFG